MHQMVEQVSMPCGFEQLMVQQRAQADSGGIAEAQAGRACNTSMGYCLLVVLLLLLYARAATIQELLPAVLLLFALPNIDEL
jgi:hypothetical protein